MRNEMIGSEENEILLACREDDFKRAATLALNCYRNEILGFLAASLENNSTVDDVFSIFLEDFWRGLPGFEWQCSVRAWAYTLARHAAARYMVNPAQRPRHLLALSDISEIADVADALQNTTPKWLQTSMKNKLQELRKQLLPKDQAILILRVDRGLSWRELTMVMSDSNRFRSEHDLDLEVRKFRKRFERIKAKLKRLAEREGLMQDPS